MQSTSHTHRHGSRKYSAISSASGDVAVASASPHCFNLAKAPHSGRG
jgi:hypothetical protein